jgi:spermidine synthase
VQAWRTIAQVQTGNERLELRQRGRDFLIVVDGRVLMTSVAHPSEDELARLACASLPPRPRVLIGGLGMGYTLRAALDELPSDAAVHVVELNPEIVAWCRGPIAALSGNAIEDPRVTVEVADVAAVIARARPASYQAIALDLYEGPHGNRNDDPLYGVGALKRTAAALAPGGVLAVWSEEADRPFETRLGAAGFAVTTVRVRRGGRAHVVYTGRRP